MNTIDNLNAINDTVNTYATDLETIYKNETAGEYTFNGLLFDFVNEIENVTGPHSDNDRVHALIREFAALLDEIYTHRTAGDYTMHGVLSTFFNRMFRAETSNE